MVTVIKVGGSLAEKGDILKRLSSSLVQYAKNHTLVVIPGGGLYADLVRFTYRKFRLSATTAHLMAILAMDQYGLLIQNLASGSLSTYSPRKALSTANQGTLPILLPSRIMATQDLEHSWKVTSDTISAHMANILRADMLILAKDVDGIYTNDPKRSSKVKLIRSITAEILATHKGCGVVDQYLPQTILKNKLASFIINGMYPSRIEGLLRGKNVICTRITV